MKLTGSTRIQLNVSDFAVSRDFYDALMGFLEAKVVFEDAALKYWLGGRTALAIAQCDALYRHERFVPGRVGLHHFSLRVRHRDDVDRAHELVTRLRATIIHEPGTWPWGSSYYSFEFEDPDGIRLEICHALGRGYLDRTMTVPIPRPEKGAGAIGLSCGQLDAFFDGELPAGESQAFRVHLPTCERCQATLQGRIHEEIVVNGAISHRSDTEWSDDEASGVAQGISDDIETKKLKVFHKD